MRLIKDNLPIVIIAALTISAFAFILISSGSQEFNPQIRREIELSELLGENPHIKGEATASATLVEFSDFECPACAAFQPYLNQLEQTYKGSLRIVYKHFPLPMHTNARKAAEASEAASAQGKFWEYHDKLFENQKDLSVEALKQYAKDLGLDTERFNKELDEGKYADIVEKDSKFGIEAGVNATPTFYLNGKYLDLRSGQDLEEEIKKAVAGN